MQQALMDLALERAGFSSLEQFIRAKGLSSQEAAHEALMPWILGYDLWRVHSGDTFSRIARELGSSVEAIQTANPRLVPENLPVGAYVVVPFLFPVVPENAPFTWQLTHYVIRGLQARYPFLDMSVIGESAYGRPLEQIRLGRGGRVVLCNASHHANEWITTPALLSMIEQYARAAAFGETLLGQDARQIAAETSLFAVPLVNPDGVDLVNGAATPAEEAAARAIAEDYPDIPFPAGWKANLQGVDLNLNYPARWEEGKKLKYELGFTSPAPRDFVGTNILSAPESLAMYAATKAQGPEVVVAWHTQGEEIYWKFLDLAPAGARRLGLQMAQASGYQLQEVPYAASFGGYKDWFIQDYDRPGYTVEAGLGENPLPLAQLPDIIKANLPVLLLALTGGRILRNRRSVLPLRPSPSRSRRRERDGVRPFPGAACSRSGDERTKPGRKHALPSRRKLPAYCSCLPACRSSALASYRSRLIRVLLISGVLGRYTTSTPSSRRKSNFPAQSSPITNTSAWYSRTSVRFWSQVVSGITRSTYRTASTSAFRWS